jgi:hypothetical protein
VEGTLKFRCNFGARKPAAQSVMPRYFFHLHTEAGIEKDIMGLEFPSLEAAVADAQEARREYLSDEGVESTRERSQCRFEITDQSGRVVATVPDADL